jgi:hypothetical protein
MIGDDDFIIAPQIADEEIVKINFSLIGKEAVLKDRKERQLKVKAVKIWREQGALKIEFTEAESGSLRFFAGQRLSFLSNILISAKG